MIRRGSDVREVQKKKRKRPVGRPPLLVKGCLVTDGGNGTDGTYGTYGTDVENGRDGRVNDGFKGNQGPDSGRYYRVTNRWNASPVSSFTYINDALGRRTNRLDDGSVQNAFSYNGLPGVGFQGSDLKIKDNSQGKISRSDGPHGGGRQDKGLTE